jgi:hypothetical protein
MSIEGHLFELLVLVPTRSGMGTTIFLNLDDPASGGDTFYLSITEAYNHLSNVFRERLHGLYAMHSGFHRRLSAIVEIDIYATQLRLSIPSFAHAL